MKNILLCQSTDHSVVEYAMSRSMSPTMVAEYHRQLIPKEVIQKSLDEFCAFLFEKKIKHRKYELFIPNKEKLRKLVKAIVKQVQNQQIINSNL